jgi:nucleoside-diphosphate-sugar epimerase
LAGTWGRYENYHLANVQATEFLLDGARANGVHRFINISSPSIYFDFKDQFNLSENQLPPKFSNAYAKTKYEAELMVRSYHSSGLNTVSLRPRSVIGDGDRNILPRLLRLHQEGRLFQVGKGDNIVDITCIGNLIDAVSLCLNAPENAMGETYNITNGTPERFWSFVEEVLQTAGMSIKRKTIPYRPLMFVAKVNEILNRIVRSKSEPALLPITVGIMSFSMTLDISKARQKLGYAPRYSTSDGIKEYFSKLS